MTDECINYDDYPNKNSEDYVGFGGATGNIIMILISICGIVINSLFSFIYLKKIITIKNKNNFGVSAVEKILCIVAVVETIISVCWLINDLFLKTLGEIDNNCGVCKAIAHAEIFFYLFDWMILSTSLYQVKIILLNPEQILESGKRVIKYLVISFTISISSLIFTLSSGIGGVSPMKTCFIDINHLTKTHHHIFFWLFFMLPIFCFVFGGYQVYLTVTSSQYKNDKKNQQFFIEYSYFVITYIVFSVLLILSYIINYLLSKPAKESPLYSIFMMIITLFSCLSPLIVGIIRVYRTEFFKSLFSKKKTTTIKEGEEELINGDDEDAEEGGRMFDLEKTILEKLIIKYFTAISYALGKSKYANEENEESTGNIKENEEGSVDPKESVEYKITKSEIVKDLDLSINEDIKVLRESNIDIEVTEYNSSTFRKLRELEGFNEDTIISMFQPKKGTNQLISKINDTLYINSTNKLLMLRQIKKEELLFYQRNVLPGLYNYLVNNPKSILCRVFGLYKIKIDQQKENYMALLYNINESLETINNIQLSKKGTREMKLSEKDLRKNIIIDSNKNDEEFHNFTMDFPSRKHIGSIRIGGGSESDSSSKAFKIHFTEYENEKFSNIIKQDTEFLRGKNSYGFSFLVFERIVNKDALSLPKEGEEKEESKSQLNKDSKPQSQIKKYIFNSNMPNIIYNICILDFFRNKA